MTLFPSFGRTFSMLLTELVVESAPVLADKLFIVNRFCFRLIPAATSSNGNGLK